MKIANKDISPYLLILISFIILILIGGTILSLPISTTDGKGTSLINGIFTATSAVCVTGLAVNNVSTVYNVFGKTILLFLIQMGALGLITISSLVVILVSKKIGYNMKRILQEAMNTESTFNIQDYIKSVFRTVFGIEIIGAFVLFFEFIKIMPFRRAVFYSIFHSVSAFCNAGFALFDDNLLSFNTSIIINIVIPLLVILGGTGFATLQNIYNYYISKKVKRLNLTSRIGLKTYFILLFAGFIFILILEYTNINTMGNYSFFEKISAAFFQSMTTRTAGFNTISIVGLRKPTVIIFLIMMFIGASPGSTGGGIKTTTIGVIFLGVLNTLRNSDKIENKDRSINWIIYNRAIAIIIISLVYIALILFLLTLIETNVDSADLLFETVSAFGTVGLSRDLTPLLKDTSKFLIIITMFIGRVGPLTAALALSTRIQKKGHYSYPEENIIIG